MKKCQLKGQMSRKSTGRADNKSKKMIVEFLRNRFKSK